MKKTCLLLCALAALLFAGGCATQSVNTVEREDPVGSPNVVDDRRIVTDTSLGRHLSVVRVNEGTASGDLARVQVILRSNRSKPMTINYRFEWYDLDGMLVSTASGGWKPLRLMGKEQKAIGAVAPNPRAVDFVLKLQEPTVK